MRVPKVNFFIVGAQKAGTSSIVHHLNQHPKIRIPNNEIHYFDQNLVNYDFDFYENKFQYSYDYLIGDKTPSYLYIRNSINGICEYNPSAKLIISLRNPIHRAFSEWNMYKQAGFTNKPFIDTLKDCEKIGLEDIVTPGYHALQRGLYYEQISYVLTKFKREKLHIVVSEKMLEDTECEIKKILNFLNVEEHSEINYSQTVHKRVYEVKMTDDEYSYLKDFYKKPNEKLFNMLGYEIEEWQN